MGTEEGRGHPDDKQSSYPEGDVQARDPHTLLIATIHAIFLRHGFRLSDTMSDVDHISQRSFTYKHSQSCMTFLVSHTPMDTELVTVAMAKEDKEKKHLKTWTVTDYIHWNTKLEPAEMLRDLQGLERELEEHILSKILPMKTGSAGTASEEPTHQSTGTAVPPQSSSPESDNYFNILNPLRPPVTSAGAPQQPINPLGIGRSDLDPFGRIVPGGGMIVGPEHPLFDSQRPGGALPPGMAPPGARFDAIVPDSNVLRPPRSRPPFRGRGPRGSPFPGRAPIYPGEPDFDEFPPPGVDGGYRDMFM